MRHSNRLVALVAAVVAVPFVAGAQQPPPGYQQQPPPGYYQQPPPGYQQQPPGNAPQQNGEYTTPLQQQTQPIYIPQSVALTGPRVIKDWEPGEPIPPGYHPVGRMRKGLVIGGAVTFGSLYLFSVLAAATSEDITSSFGASNPLVSLYIPVLGPFIEMKESHSASADVFLVLDGLGQAGGLAMFIVGLVAKKTVLIRNDLARLELKPMIGRATSGMMLTGTF